MSERISDAQPENFSEEQLENIDAILADEVAAMNAGAEEIPDEEIGMTEDQRQRAANMKEAKWYVVHTYSGYENKVKDTLEKSIKGSGMENYIFEVRVPVEDVTEIKKGKRVKTTRKVFPGYVIVFMLKTNQSWYVVRNTRGVTGFVGPDGQPVALTEAEVEMMLNPQPTVTEFDLAIGESVLVQEGTFEGQRGEIVEIDKMLGKVLVRLHPFANRTTEQWFHMEDVIIAEAE